MQTMVRDMSTTDKKSGDFAFLVQAARTLGAADAKVIPASDVIVENRVPLKCRAGCIGYGKKLTCPPYVPTPDEFRKILAEYRYALLVKFISPATADPGVICSIYGTGSTQRPRPTKGKSNAFWKDHFDGTGAFAPMMLESSNGPRSMRATPSPLPSSTARAGSARVAT